MGGNPGSTVRRIRDFLGPAQALAALALSLGLGGGLYVVAKSQDAVAQAELSGDRPNIVVVMTDDQDEASVRVMDQVQRRVAGPGVTYDNGIATYPLCCPSRATYITGQYAHNHGVLDNDAPRGGYDAFAHPETAMPVALDRAGYRTALIGKYLNGYDVGDPIPPGWDEWRAAVGEEKRSYRYDLNENGELVHYGSAPGAYKTTVYARKAEGFIKRAHQEDEPFFLTVATNAPHSPATPGPGYEGRFDDEPLPLPPSFDEVDVSDKPESVRDLPQLDDARLARLEDEHRRRLASLLPVDKLVGRLLDTLRDTDELRNTYVLFFSDNGWLQGEHRIRGKGKLYEESIGTPLMIRGPGLPNEVRSQLVGNIDMAPTLLDIADAEPLRVMDGSSLLAPPKKRDLLLENFMEEDAPIRGVRAPGWMYAEHPNGEEELYDLRADPYQLQSLHDDPAYDAVEATLEARLRTLEDCAGASCR